MRKNMEAKQCAQKCEIVASTVVVTVAAGVAPTAGVNPDVPVSLAFVAPRAP